MKLGTISVHHWPEFQFTQNVRFDCPCLGRVEPGTHCLECGDTKVVFPVNSTAYDTGYEVAGPINRMPYGGVVAFAYRGHVWLATRLCEGVPAAPFLAAAWLRMFPKTQWLPEQFGDVNSVPEFYANLPKDDADAVVAKLRESLSLNLEKSQADLEKLNQMDIPPS